MTIEESWKIVNEEMHLQNSVLFKAVHDATWKISSKNQREIDIEKACDLLLITLKELKLPYDFACGVKDRFKQAMEE